MFAKPCATAGLESSALTLDDQNVGNEHLAEFSGLKETFIDCLDVSSELSGIQLREGAERKDPFIAACTTLKDQVNEELIGFFKAKD